MALGIITVYLLYLPRNVNGMDLNCRSGNHGQHPRVTAVVVDSPGGAPDCSNWIRQLASHVFCGTKNRGTECKISGMLKVNPNDIKNMLLLTKLYWLKFRNSKGEAGLPRSMPRLPQQVLKNISIDFLLQNIFLWEFAANVL